MLFYSAQSQQTPAFLSVFIQLVFVQVARCRPDSHKAESSDGVGNKSLEKNKTKIQNNITWVAVVVVVERVVLPPARACKYDSYQEYSLAARVVLLLKQCARTSELSLSFQLNALRLLCSSAILSVLACRGVTVYPFQSSDSWPIVEVKKCNDSEMRRGFH